MIAFTNRVKDLEKEILGLKSSGHKSSSDMATVQSSITVPFSLDGEGVAIRKIWLDPITIGSTAILASVGVDLSKEQIDTEREFWAELIEDINGRLGFCLHAIGSDADVAVIAGGGSVVLNWPIVVISNCRVEIELV